MKLKQFVQNRNVSLPRNIIKSELFYALYEGNVAILKDVVWKIIVLYIL